jgi:hypothetical protein
LAAPVAALLFVVALVVWLSEIMGSIVYPCLLIGAFFALIATILYKVSLRDVMREMDERIRLLSEFIGTLREGVEWVMRLLFGGAK